MDDLKRIRKKIDKIDAEILELIGERLKLAAEIAGIKKKLKMGIRQPKREREILYKIGAVSKKKKIDAGFARGIFRKIIAHTRKIEKK